MILGAVTIRERVECVRIEDPFVVDQFVVIGTRSGAELILFGIPVHAMGLDDGMYGYHQRETLVPVCSPKLSPVGRG